MSDVVIRAENLGKRYRIGGPQARYKTLRDTITDLAVAPLHRLRRLGQPTPPEETIWALRDVSFEVKRGEVVGIIGRNGAGKTTLLRVLCRITEPTEGQAEMHGRVGSLLQVGTGFHPELTGRENIYLNGAILGMKRVEIDKKFDDIVEFAGIEKFLDTPAKRYSSGMYVRLAFAVAAHLEPEILLVDEVLAVGDAAFQKKCLGKMGDVAREGRTVLFVSHNMGAITRLCQRSILLSEGVAVFDGESDVAVRRYLKDATLNATRRVFFEDNPDLPIVIRQVAVTMPGKTDTDVIDVSDPLFVEIHYRVKNDIRGTRLLFSLKRDGIVLFRSWDIDRNKDVYEMRKSGDYVAKIALPRRLFAPGLYSILVAVGGIGWGVMARYDDCVSFEIESTTDDPSQHSYSSGGLLVMPLIWESTRIQEG